MGFGCGSSRIRSGRFGRPGHYHLVLHFFGFDFVENRGEFCDDGYARLHAETCTGNMLPLHHRFLFAVLCYLYVIVSKLIDHSAYFFSKDVELHLLCLQVLTVQLVRRVVYPICNS